MKSLPKKVQIGSRVFSVVICDSPSDVDIHKQQSLWGQIDYWKQVIRIYKRGYVEMHQTLLHEILHGILATMGRDDLNNDEKFIQVFTDMLEDTYRRNNI